MSDFSWMSDSASEPDVIPTRLGYQCRFPVEVLKNILSFLALEILYDDDQMAPHTAIIDDFGFDHTLSDDPTPSDDLAQLSRSPVTALRAVQQSSSAMYQVATPVLYRYLRVTHHALIRLLWRSMYITRIDEVINQDPENDSHPLDYHLYHRLQWALSFVKEVHLTIYHSYDLLEGYLKDYTDIGTALEVFGRPHLWSALDKVSVRVRSIDGRKTGDEASYACFPFKSEIIQVLGPTLSPTFLEIELPDPPPYKHFKANPTDLNSSLWSMRADHVTVSNLTDASQGVPNVRLSLTIGFSARCGKIASSQSSDLSRQSQALAERCQILKWSISRVPNLTLIGIERGLGALSLSHVRAELGRALEESGGSMFGRERDVRYRIRPWNSSEQGDWNVWHSYDEPFGEHFSRSDLERADDNGDDDRGSDDAEVESVEHEEASIAAYEILQNEVKGGVYAINAKVVATERRIESMVKRIGTLGKTMRTHTDSMVEMKGNQIAIMENMARMMSTMKELASKASRGTMRSRSRRYQGKRTAKKAGKRAEEGESGWLDE